MSSHQEQGDLRSRQQVAEQAKKMAESLAGKADAEKKAEFPREFAASGTGKVTNVAAIEP